MSTSQTKIDIRLRALEALRLRHETDHTWQEIADQCGYSSQQAAQRAVVRVLSRVETENVSQYRNLFDTQLAWLWDQTSEKLIDADRGSMSYATLVQSAVRIVDRRAKLHGVDASTKAEVKVAITRGDVDSGVEKLLTKLGVDPGTAPAQDPQENS